MMSNRITVMMNSFAMGPMVCLLQPEGFRTESGPEQRGTAANVPGGKQTSAATLKDSTELNRNY
jgi:hypothetical protein